jgi:hypothetical protein
MSEGDLLFEAVTYEPGRELPPERQPGEDYEEDDEEIFPF